jgi:hypothetical protein
VPVSQHEVDELRREGEAQSLDAADCTLQTSAELLGFVIYSARSMGADQTETLAMVELLVRATDMWREDIREARNVLQALNYPPAISQLLTALARRAPPRPPLYFRGVGHRCRSCTASVSRRRHFQMGPAKKIFREFFRTGSVAELFAPSPPDGPPNRARGR